MKKLQQQSKEQRYDEILTMFGGNGIEETQKAREAKKILDEANIVITLEEMKELKHKSKEKKYDEMLAALGEDGMIETQEARDSKEILNKANIAITLEEMEDLEQQSKEQRYDKNDIEFKEDIMKKAKHAQDILNKNNLMIGFGETKKRALFTSIEIGKATLKQQENTEEKINEEKSRNENQKLLEELGKE